jgi:hypothetical protein
MQRQELTMKKRIYFYCPGAANAAVFTPAVHDPSGLKIVQRV